MAANANLLALSNTSGTSANSNLLALSKGTTPKAPNSNLTALSRGITPPGTPHVVGVLNLPQLKGTPVDTSVVNDTPMVPENGNGPLKEGDSLVKEDGYTQPVIDKTDGPIAYKASILKNLNNPATPTTATPAKKSVLGNIWDFTKGVYNNIVGTAINYSKESIATSSSEANVLSDENKILKAISANKAAGKDTAKLESEYKLLAKQKGGFDFGGSLISSGVEGVAKPFTEPDEAEIATEKQLTDDSSIPGKVLGAPVKAAMRFVSMATQGYAEQFGGAIADYDIANGVANGTLPPEVLGNINPINTQDVTTSILNSAYLGVALYGEASKFGELFMGDTVPLVKGAPKEDITPEAVKLMNEAKGNFPDSEHLFTQKPTGPGTIKLYGGAPGTEEIGTALGFNEESVQAATNLMYKVDASKMYEDFKQGREDALTKATARQDFLQIKDGESIKAQQLSTVINKEIPDVETRQVAKLYRENKIFQQFNDEIMAGTSDEYQKFADEYVKNNPKATDEEVIKAVDEAKARVQKYADLQEKASRDNATPQVKNIDEVVGKYYDYAYKKGKETGVLGEDVASSETYSNRIILNSDNDTFSTNAGGQFPKKFAFGKQRTFDTTLQAILWGKDVNLDISNDVSIYGDRYGTATAIQTYYNKFLKPNDLGTWGFDGEVGTKIPADWKAVGGPFQHQVKFIDSKGNPQVSTQQLYMPPKIAEAFKPLFDTKSLGDLPYYSALKRYQSVLKTAELSISTFHMKALSISALNNMGFENSFRALQQSMLSPEFLAAERDLVESGGTSPVMGRVLDSWGNMKESMAPDSVMSNIKKLPIINQADALANKISDLTFGTLQRKYKVWDFSSKVTSYIAEHPEISDSELLSAKRSIAKQVNSTYGGLNWDAMGVTKMGQQIMRMVMLAPDWTVSNVASVKYAFEGGPSGTAARMFWGRSMVYGVIASQLMSLAISGHTSKDWTSVYFGKDKVGKDIYQNMFFAGAPQDLTTFIRNANDYGLLSGAGQSAGAKASPLLRIGIQTVTNRTYLGQQINVKGLNPIASSARSLAMLGQNAIPLPFTVMNPLEMYFDKSGNYTWPEYIATALGGSRPRHVVPPGMREVTSGAHKGELKKALPAQQQSIIQQALTNRVNKLKKK